MPLMLDGTELDSVLIVDDDPKARLGFSFAIEDLGLIPIFQSQSLAEVEPFFASLRPNTAVFSDFRLRPGNFASFDGDKLIAACYQRKIPAILCTTYVDVDQEIDRSLLRYIPVLLRNHAPPPETIRQGFRDCISEFAGRLPAHRKPWRTLVRIHEVDNERRIAYVVVPGWNVNKKIPLRLSSFPEEISKHISQGKRFHAQVNIGSETYEGLYFHEWEPS